MSPIIIARQYYCSVTARGTEYHSAVPLVAPARACAAEKVPDEGKDRGRTTNGACARRLFHAKRAAEMQNVESEEETGTPPSPAVSHNQIIIDAAANSNRIQYANTYQMRGATTHI